jgi:hypothetical protein
MNPGGRENSSRRPGPVEVIEPFSQILLLARFLCFMAVFYLALHKLVAHLSQNPNSKLLWFFSVLTAPLMRPVRAWTMPGTSNDQLLTKSLLFYGFVWICLIVIGKILNAPR